MEKGEPKKESSSDGDKIEDGMKSPPPETKSKLDSLSREDLIKFVKRQMMLVSKSKSQNESQAKLLEELQSQLKKAETDYNTELSELEESKTELVLAYNASQQAQEESLTQFKALEDERATLQQELAMASKLKHTNKELQEQIECLNMKNETMTTSFQAIQQDCDQNKSVNKDLDEQISVLTIARDEMVQQIQQLKHSNRLQSEQSQNSRTNEEFEELQQKYEEVVEKCARLDVELSNAAEALKTLGDNESLTKINEKLEADVEELIEEQSHYKSTIEKLQKEKDQLSQDFNTFKRSSESFREQMSSVQDLLKQMEEDKNTLQQDKEQLEAQQIAAGQLVEQLKLQLQERDADSENTAAQMMDELKEQIKERDIQEQNRTKEIVDLQQKTVELEASLVQSKQQVDQLTKLNEDIEQQYTNGADSLHSKLDQVQKINCELQTQLEVVELQKIGSDEELNKSKNTIEQAMIKLQALEQQKIKMVSRVRAANEQAKEWENMMGLLKDDRERLEAELVEHEERESNVKIELDEMNSSMQQALAERDVLQSQVYTMSEAQIEIDEQKLQMAKSVEQIKSESELLNDENNRQQSEINDLQEKLNSSQHEYEEIKCKLNDSVQELHMKSTENQSLQDADKSEICETLIKEKEQLLISAEELKRQIQIQDSKIEKLTKELCDANGQIEGFIPERQLMEDKLKEQSNIRRKYDELVDDNNRIKEQLSDRDAGVSENIEELERVKKVLHDLEEEKCKVDELHKEALIHIQELKEQCQKKDQQIEEEIGKFDELIVNKDTIVQQMSNLQSQFESLEKENEKLQQSAQSESVLVMEKDKIEAELQEMAEKLKQSEHSGDTLCEVKMQLERVEQNKDELAKSNQQKISDLEELNVVCEKLKKHDEQLTHDNEILEIAKNELQTQIDNLKKELDDVKTQLSVSEEKQTALTSTLDLMKCGTDDTEQQMVDVQSELIECKTQVSDLKQQCEKMESENTLLTENKKVLLQSGDEKQQQIVALESENHDMAKIVQESKQKCEKLLGNVEELLNQKQSLSSELDTVMTAKQEVENKLDDSQTECEKVTAALHAVENSAESQTQMLTDCENRYEEKVAMLEKEKEDLNSQIDEFHGKIAKLDDYEIQLQEKDEFVKKLVDKMNDEIEVKEQRVEECLELQKQLETLKNKEQLVQSAENDSAGVIEGLQSEITTLKEQVQSGEEKCSKIKQLALRSKKEANDLKAKLEQTTNEMNEINNTSRQQAHNYESIQHEYDQLQNTIEDWQSKYKTLNTEKDGVVKELSDVTDMYSALQERERELNLQLEQLTENATELENAVTAAESEKRAEIITKEQVMKDNEQLSKEISGLQSDIQKLKDESEKSIVEVTKQYEDTKSQLQSAVKDTKQQSMMDLEIKDYERTIETLTDTINVKDEEITTQQQELSHHSQQIEQLHTQIETLESQHIQSEDRGNKLKQLLVKCKKDLSDAKKLEAEQRGNDAQLNAQIEVLTQLCEEQKLQITSLSVEKQKVQEKLSSLMSGQDRAVKTADMRTKALKQDLQLSKTELENIQTEYEAYKVRVHNVLKQQKTRAANEVTIEQEKQEKEHLNKLVEQLKSKLTQTSTQLMESKSEMEMLEEEHERLQERHSRLISDRQEVENSWRRKLEAANLEATLASTEHLDTIQQLTQQNKLLASSFKEQMSVLHSDHSHTVQLLQTQVDHSANELARWQNETQNTLNTSAASAGNRSPSGGPRMLEEDVLEVIREPQWEERGTGEGMENTDVPNTPASDKSPSIPSTPLSLEHLLNNPIEATLVKPLEVQVDPETMKEAVNLGERKIQHLSELLNESEVTIMRMTEQSKLLKEEIRRLERNQERETSVSNMEYLKNIVFKFLTLKNNAERNQLIPVLHTMLCLSTAEKDILAAIAAVDVKDESKGWSAYLHRWSGLT